MEERAGVEESMRNSGFYVGDPAGSLDCVCDYCNCAFILGQELARF